MATIPGARNEARNPSFELDAVGSATISWWSQSFTAAGYTGGWTVSGTQRWDRAKSARWSVTAAPASTGQAIRLGSAGYALAALDGRYYSFVARGLRENANYALQLQLAFFAAGGAFLGDAFQPLTTAEAAAQPVDDWFAVAYEGVVAPTGSATVAITLRGRQEVASATGSGYFDAVHFGPSENVDPRIYVDGAQGLWHGWDGAADASSSYRLERPTTPATGRFGALTISARCERRTLANAPVPDGDGDRSYLLTGGTVGFDADRSPRFVASLRFGGDPRIDVLNDALAVFVDTESERGVTSTQVGLFVADEPDRDQAMRHATSTVDGADVTRVLARWGTGNTYNIAPGTNRQAAAVAVCAVAGITRTNFPATDAVFADGLSFGPDAVLLTILDTILASYGCYHAWGDRVGVPTSRRYLDLATEQAARTILASDEATIGAVKIDNASGDLANRAVVIRESPSGILTKTVDLPASSPLSKESRGGRIVAYVHKDPQLADQPTVDATAIRVLDEQSSKLVKAEIGIVPDPTREPFEVWDLAVAGEDPDGPWSVLEGRFRVNAWTLPLSGADGPMRVALQRSERGR